MPNLYSCLSKASSYQSDSNDDGLSDGDEVGLGTDPLDPDTDDDGLSDGDEVGLGTDPLNPDKDGHGILDGSDPDILANIVEGLDGNVFKSNGGGHRTAILRTLNNTERAILKGNNTKAIRKLQKLRTRMDGVRD